MEYPELTDIQVYGVVGGLISAIVPICDLARTREILRKLVEDDAFWFAFSKAKSRALALGDEFKEDLDMAREGAHLVTGLEDIDS